LSKENAVLIQTTSYSLIFALQTSRDGPKCMWHFIQDRDEVELQGFVTSSF